MNNCSWEVSIVQPRLGRQKRPVVEVIKRRKPKKQPPKPAVFWKKEDKPISIASGPFYSGSQGQCIAFSFSQKLNGKQKDFVEKRIKNHECGSYVHDIRWRDHITVVVEVKIRSLQDCSRIDINRAIELLAYEIPVNLK